MIARIRNLVWKEFIQLRRDWVMAGFILTLPVLQLMLLASATTSSIDDLSVAVLDNDRTSISRRITVSLRNREELEIRHLARTLGHAEELLDGGDAILVIVIPRGFETAIERPSESVPIQIIADGSNDLVADIALGAARDAIRRVAQEAIESHPEAPSFPIELRTAVRYNPGFDVELFALPAQVGFIVYQVTLAVASIGIARERELGTLEQLIVMPMRRLELVVGKAIPALIVGMVNFSFMFCLIVWGFSIPMRGSLPLLLALTLLFVAVEIGYGILISGIARTQQQAILLVFVLAMVDMAFSGYLVRIKNLPITLQTIAWVVPLRHYLTVIRAVMLKGAGLGALWQHATAMTGMGILIMVLAARTLSRRLD